MYLTSLEDATFKTILPHVKVFARVSPKQKVGLDHLISMVDHIILLWIT